MILLVLVLAAAVYYYWDQIQAQLSGTASAADPLGGTPLGGTPLGGIHRGLGPLGGNPLGPTPSGSPGNASPSSAPSAQSTTGRHSAGRHSAAPATVTQQVPVPDPVTFTTTIETVTLPASNADPSSDASLLAWFRMKTKAYHITSATALAAKVRSITAWVRSAKADPNALQKYVDLWDSDGVAAANSAITVDIKRLESQIFA